MYIPFHYIFAFVSTKKALNSKYISFIFSFEIFLRPGDHSNQMMNETKIYPLIYISLSAENVLNG